MHTMKDFEILRSFSNIFIYVDVDNIVNVRISYSYIALTQNLLYSLMGSDLLLTPI